MGSLQEGTRRVEITTEPRARLRIRLVGGPEGRIPLSDLAHLAGSLQNTVHRIARSISGRAGRGRSPKELERLALLEAAEIAPGSTVLVVEAPGLAEVLPLESIGDDVGLQALDRLSDAMEALQQGESLPPEVDELSQEGLREMLDALSSYETVEWNQESKGQRRRRVELVPLVAAERLTRIRPEQLPETETVVGELYQVNLHTHRYTVEDDLGRTIPCEFPDDVAHLDEIRGLVGRRVIVVGRSFRDPTGRIERLEVESMSPEPPVGDADVFYAFDVEAALAAISPVADLASLRIEGLSAEEAEEFWRAVTE